MIGMIWCTVHLTFCPMILSVCQCFVFPHWFYLAAVVLELPHCQDTGSPLPQDVVRSIPSRLIYDIKKRIATDRSMIRFSPPSYDPISPTNPFSTGS